MQNRSGRSQNVSPPSMVPGAVDAPERRDAGRLGPGLQQRRLAGAVRLAGAERDGAAVGHEQRIERVDEVRIVGLGLEDVDRRPEPGQDLEERVVLAARNVEVDRVQEAVRGIVECAPEGFAGPFDEHVAQRGGHALGAVAPLGQRHAERIVARRRSEYPATTMAAYAVIARIDRVDPHLRRTCCPATADAWPAPEPLDPPRPSTSWAARSSDSSPSAGRGSARSGPRRRSSCSTPKLALTGASVGVRGR